LTLTIFVDVAVVELYHLYLSNTDSTRLSEFRVSLIQNEVSSVIRQFLSWSAAAVLPACLVGESTDKRSCIPSAPCWLEMK
jgi:hypothetical protein